MPKRKEPVKLRFVEVVPDLTPEERARRVERFVDTLAKVNEVPGYVGCKYFTEKGYGVVYMSE